MNIYELKDTYHYAMHGNGAFKGLRQTNTEDALMYWYSKGIRVFEIDMAETADGDYVAVAHYLNKKDLRRLELFELPNEAGRTKNWFMSQRLFTVSTLGLKPLSLETIIYLMDKHRDIVVMLDLFGLFTIDEAAGFTKVLVKYIESREKVWDRLLLESYNKEMLKGIRSVSDRANIIACVRYEENENAESTVTAQELLSQGVYFISYPWYCTEKHPGELETYARNGITVFSRTKDNTKESKLKRAGVSVNIVAQKYDGARIIYQYPLYIMTYIKRMLVKIYIKMKRK